MVHLPPDSRLLASLVKQEQAYSSQLYNLLNTSNSSLSALVIYASSSPTEISNTLKNVANALSGADDAFRDYGEAVNNWIDQLRSISRKEEEVANMGRQREILVTRLIKVSQKSKASPQSLLYSASDSASTVSFRSFNTKVSAAQMELQACESHLATQERELEAFRLTTLKHGLQLRCQALVQCAWTWGELGRRCLSFLADVNEIPSLNGTSAPGISRPLLTNGVYDHDRESALSSLAPSQSVSQIGSFNDTQTNVSPPVNLYSLNIPPPHRVPENGTIPVPSPTKPQFQQQQRQEEEATSSESTEGQVEVHENPQYKSKSVLDKARGSIRKDSSPSPQRSPTIRFQNFNPDINSSTSYSSQGDRKSHGLFGGLASLFKTSMSGKASQQRSGWGTRTDRNIRSVKTDNDDSSDEEHSNAKKLSKRRLRSGQGQNPNLNGPTPLTVPPPSPISTHQPSRSRKESLTRSGTVRSTASEPPSNARSSRDRVLSLTSNGPHQPLYIPPERRLSFDGRPASMRINDSKRLSQHEITTLKRSSPSKAERGLSRIAEDASPIPNGPSNPSKTAMNLQLPQAPPSVFASRLNSESTTITSGGGAGPSGRTINFPTASGSGSPMQRDKKPLKSALRNTSRERDGSTSPLPTASASSSSSPAVLPALLSTPIPRAPPLRPLTPISPIPSDSASHPVSGTPPPLQLSGAFVSSATPSPPDRPSSPHPSVSDISSISSYETGRENFYEDDGEDGDRERETEEHGHSVDFSTIPVLLSSQPQPPTQVDTHEISSVTSGDTAIANDVGSGGVTRRRKSVRMSSLPPEVLERSPTQEDYEEGGLFTTRKSPRRPSFSPTATTITAESTWKSRAPTEDPSNVWIDSSEEDEGYKAAKRALSRTKRHTSLARK